MAARSESLAVNDALLVEFIDNSAQVVAKVGHIVVVHAAAGPEDGRVRLHYRVAEQRHVVHRARAEVRETIQVERTLGSVVGLLVRELARIEPEERRKTIATPVRRQRYLHPELDAVDARNRNHPALQR